MKREVRTFDIEARSAEGADSPTKIVGYAAVFNTIAHGEMISPGAFKKTMEEQRDIKAYVGHNINQILARRENGTLKIGEDERGLWVEIEPNLSAQSDRDMLAKVERGDINQMSFGFSPVKEEFAEIDGDKVRVLKEVRLFEVSVVTEPWYETTVAEAREAETEQPEPVLAGHSTVTEPEGERCRRIERLRLFADSIKTRPITTAEHRRL